MGEDWGRAEGMFCWEKGVGGSREERRWLNFHQQAAYSRLGCACRQPRFWPLAVSLITFSRRVHFQSLRHKSQQVFPTLKNPVVQECFHMLGKALSASYLRPHCLVEMVNDWGNRVKQEGQRQREIRQSLFCPKLCSTGYPLLVSTWMFLFSTFQRIRPASANPMTVAASTFQSVIQACSYNTSPVCSCIIFKENPFTRNSVSGDSSWQLKAKYIP